MKSTVHESLSRAFGVRVTALERAGARARSRARALGLDLREYLRRLEVDVGEQSRLAEVTTNGWTWFHRDPEALERGLEAARRSERVGPLRVWVAGCSTGEEAYTLAMLAERHALDVDVLATDIDGRRIAFARAARYEPHALRHVPDADRDRFFERRGDHFTPRARVRERARFEVHNLLAPPPRHDSGPWDLVCCRNVLIHATAEMAPRMLGQLQTASRGAAPLVLGAADELAIARRPSRVPPAPPPKPAPAVDRLGRWLAAGNEHLGRHELDDALVAYSMALGSGPGQDELLLMIGLTHRKRGDRCAAEHAIRRAVSLSPDLWLGWMLLAGLYERQGRVAHARAALESALQGLERSPRWAWRVPAAGVEERDMDAARAARVCRARLEVIERRGDHEDE